MQGLVKAYSLFVILRADAEYTHPNDWIFEPAKKMQVLAAVRNEEECGNQYIWNTVDNVKLMVETPKLLCLQELVSTEWFWESSTVHMDTSPDFLESLSQPSPDVR
jgi:hypothetical protein